MNNPIKVLLYHSVNESLDNPNLLDDPVNITLSKTFFTSTPLRSKDKKRMIISNQVNMYKQSNDKTIS